MTPEQVFREANAGRSKGGVQAHDAVTRKVANIFFDGRCEIPEMREALALSRSFHGVTAESIKEFDRSYGGH